MTGLLLLALIQDLDVALTRESRRATSVLDEISDPAERKAFETLYQETDPLRRRTLASDFLRRHPASWLYAQAHEAAAQDPGQHFLYRVPETFDLFAKYAV